MDGQNPDSSVSNESGRDVPVSVQLVKQMASLVAEYESAGFSLLEVVYVDEEEIVRINKEYLNSSYVTDIITFRYDEKSHNKEIEGTLFCCAPRIYEQAKEFLQDPETEFQRILVHGLLHLCGYEDDTEQSKRMMTEKENRYLDMLQGNNP